MKLKKSVEKQTYELKKEIAVRQNTESELLLYKRVFEYALEGITITNADGTIVALNKSFENITGYSDEDVIGQSPRILKSGIHNKEFYTQMWKDLFDNGAWSGEIWNRKKSGEAFPQHLSIAAVKDTDDNISNFIAVFHDITDFKANEEKIKFQAYHDALTGLPNRLLINDRLRHAITHTERIGKKLAVIFLDLDNFKRINDTMGHLTGDKLLKCTADRLSRMMRAEDTVGRLGGDEFVIIVEDVSTNNFIVRMAERILGSFAALFEIDSKEIYVSASIGITYYPDDGSDPETLIKNADIAMYDAKESGKNRFKFFTSALNDEVVKKHNLDQRIRKAIDNDEFVAYFQPRVSLETGRPVAMETLARWVTEDGSIVSPADFIPVLEENGLIYELCRSMLIQTCEFLMRIRNELGIITKASVNLSPKQLDKPEIVDCIADLIKSFGVEPGQIEMEITENDVMRDTPKTVAIFNKLMENSISVYIDDFGTGYSSLHYLKLFPIRGLKIDRSFIRDMLEDKSDEAITRTMIIFSQTFGIEAIAEGVETKEQAEALRDMGCREVQGFYFAGPMPAEDYISYLESVFQDRA
jgi:diguanylate cyclase (GGDEF)-like protein/PAS domain S-box-containing protein